jgi:N-acetyl-anhydromuramyl-L-alanine amidase AmpD
MEDRYFDASGKLTMGSDYDPHWYTDIQLDKCANLVATLMVKYNIPLSNVIPHGAFFLKQFGNNHHDPGIYFPWEKFRQLVQSYLGAQNGTK